MIARHPGPCPEHKFQDTTYGKGVRLMNPVKRSKTEEPAYRCTVCAPPKEHSKKRGGVHLLSTLQVVRK